MRVSAHSRLPNSTGEFVAQASTGPARSWATLYRLANSAGDDLEVDLEAGVARLGHDGVLPHPQVVGALDVQLVVLAPQVHQRLVEGQVPGVLHHVLHAQVALADGGEDPGQHDLQAHRVGAGASQRQELVELALDAAEAVAGELLGVEVQLEVERAHLGREVTVGRGRQDLEGSWRRLPRGVDEEHLLFRAHAVHTGLEGLVGQQPFEGAEVLQHPADGDPPLLQPACRLEAHRQPTSRR